MFKLEAADLGNVYKIRIRHDNSGFSPAWYVDYVEVIDNSDNQKYMFHCERWLAKNKDDMKIERSFYVKVGCQNITQINIILKWNKITKCQRLFVCLVLF